MRYNLASIQLITWRQARVCLRLAWGLSMALGSLMLLLITELMKLCLFLPLVIWTWKGTGQPWEG